MTSETPTKSGIPLSDSLAGLPRFLDLRQLIGLSTLSKSAVYQEIAAGRLAAPLKIRPGRSVWRYQDVQAWLVQLEQKAMERALKARGPLIRRTAGGQPAVR